MKKAQLVNSICCFYGYGSVREMILSSKELKSLVRKHIQSWNVEAINVAYAQLQFPRVYKTWTENNPFNTTWTIRKDTGAMFTIPQWYPQPACIDGEFLQPIIDPHHLLVNSRAHCCSKGILAMGISPDAWLRVPDESNVNGTGLSLELVKELRDRQNNSFAQTTFSKNVQTEMENLGFHQEAMWCGLICEFYGTVDSAALSIEARITHLMSIRTFMLQHLDVGHFPPPSFVVKDMPMCQFEGMLTNIDRRLQLYSMIEAGSYNQRAISSLDTENFFSAFQASQ